MRIKSEICGTKAELDTYEKLMVQNLKSVINPQDKEIDAMNYRKGLIEGEIIQYRKMLERASYYESLSAKREELQSLIENEKKIVYVKEEQQQKNKKKVEEKIMEFGIYFLQNDLIRQKEFTLADEFNVDFSGQFKSSVSLVQ